MGLLDAFHSRKKRPTTPSMSAVMVTLAVADDQSLFILLGSDGSINRMGTGSATQIERDMFIGKTSLDAFNIVVGCSQPVIEQWPGS